MKSNECKIQIILIIQFFLSETKAPGNSLQQFKTLDNLGNSIYFSVKSHMLENVTSFSCVWISYPSGNTTSLYLEKNMHSIDQLIPVLMNLCDYLFISITAYANDLSTLGIFQARCIFCNHKYCFGSGSSFVILVDEVIEDKNHYYRQVIV